MKQILGALFFAAFFAFVGLAAERAPIIFALIGLGVGFWLGNR